MDAPDSTIIGTDSSAQQNAPSRRHYQGARPMCRGRYRKSTPYHAMAPARRLIFKEAFRVPIQRVLCFHARYSIATALGSRASS
jgi:hypothetical protein